MAKFSGCLRKMRRSEAGYDRSKLTNRIEKNKIRKLRKITRNLSADNKTRKQSDRRIEELEKSLRR